MCYQRFTFIQREKNRGNVLKVTDSKRESVVYLFLCSRMKYENIFKRNKREISTA